MEPTVAEMRAALDELYDLLPGPLLASLSEDTQRVILATGRRRRDPSGRGRVTNRRFDMRLKENRARS